jgi:phosphosulfolactate synthase
MEVVSDIVDYVKFNDHSGVTGRYAPELIKRKIKMYSKYGIKTFPSGTIFQIAYSNNAAEKYFRRVKELGFDCVEIDDSALPSTLDHSEKIKLIGIAKETGIEVFVEIGRKYVEKPIALNEAVYMVTSALDAGARKVIFEEAELEYAKKQGDTDTIIQLVHQVGFENLLFEIGSDLHLAVWLVKTFGPEVNIENLKMTNHSAITDLEGIRRGLHRIEGFSYFRPPA